jgi:5'-3' exonuclease|tara:strand:- start:1585 stop:2577 length:993 start_codon:yes stop_codon:yes gene_type:complete
MNNYLLVDGLNMFMRAKHVGGRGDSIDMKIGMAMHIMFNSINKCWNKFDGTHVVLCLEGRSWRKDFYKPYKANRKVTMNKRSPREQEDDELYFEAYDDMVQFFADKTNCTVLRCEIAEADDMIATWVQQHPEDNHMIVSTDSDFYQLLAPNVQQFNGTTDQLVTLEGWHELKTGNVVIDKKTKEPKVPVDPKWVLFEKCVRGDSSDNVFASYPGARLKGTKNKTGIREAFDDRASSGYNYNNFMLQRWVDHEEQEHRVRDDFIRNEILIDLTMQPDEVKELCLSRMNEQKKTDPVANIGIHFMKFCSKWNLQRMGDQVTTYQAMLNGRHG